MARRLRPGRRRKTGQRTSTGRLSRAHATTARDAGTPELQRKRLALVNGAADPALAASLADLLFAHRVLDADQRNAAIRFKGMRDRVFPPPLKNATPGPVPCEDRMAENERAYDRAARRLSDEQRCAVTDLILELRATWIRRQLLGVPLTDEDRGEREALVSGLDQALVSWTS